MKIGEVSSSVSSYQGQGSSAKTAPVQQISESKPVDFASAAKEIRASEAEYKNPNFEQNENEENSAAQATSSLKEAISKINSAQGNAEAVFGIHEGTNRVMIKMVDKETRKVIKEFPAEETLDLIAKAGELAGSMVDEKR